MSPHVRHTQGCKPSIRLGQHCFCQGDVYIHKAPGERDMNYGSMWFVFFFPALYRLNVVCVSPALYRLRCVRRGQDLAPKAAIMVWQTAHPTRTQSAKPCSPASQRLNDLPLKPDSSHEPPIQPHDTGPAHVLSPCNSSTALAIVLLYICTECDCPLKCGNDVDDLFFFFF